MWLLTPKPAPKQNEHLTGCETKSLSGCETQSLFGCWMCIMAKEKTFYLVYLELNHSIIRHCSAEEINSTAQDARGI